MTDATHTAGDILGPYSEWPRPKPRRAQRRAGILAGLTGFAVFLHCGLPLIA